MERAIFMRARTKAEYLEAAARVIMNLRARRSGVPIFAALAAPMASGGDGSRKRRGGEMEEEEGKRNKSARMEEEAQVAVAVET